MKSKLTRFHDAEFKLSMHLAIYWNDLTPPQKTAILIKVAKLSALVSHLIEQGERNA